MVRYKIKYKRPTPVEDALRVILVPVIAATLALGGLVACKNKEDDSWKHRLAPTEAPLMPRPVAHAEIQATTVPSRDTGPPDSGSTRPATSPKHEPRPTALTPKSSPRTGQPISVASKVSEPSDLRQQENFSARTDPVPESIQGCQRSAAACFAAGGLDTLLGNLDGLAIDPVTGRFCFSFQEGCRR